MIFKLVEWNDITKGININGKEKVSKTWVLKQTYTESPI